MNVNEQANEYHLMPNGDFVIANYQQKRPLPVFCRGLLVCTVFPFGSST